MSSKVLHIAPIPAGTTEALLKQMFGLFGTVTKTLIVLQKKTAFVEMEDAATAAICVAQYTASPASILGSAVNVSASKRDRISDNPRYSNGAGGNGEYKIGVPSPVLMCSIGNQKFPVTLDNLYTVFNVYGDVLRIVTFQKKVFSALIEFAHVNQAMAALANLQGKNVFQNACTLRLTYSTTPAPINVKMNNERARDFTIPMPAGGFMNGPAGPYGQQDPFASGGLPYGMDPYGAPGAPSRESFYDKGRVVLVNGLPEGKVTCENLFILFGVVGDVHRVKILYNKQSCALIQYARPDQASNAKQFLDNVTIYGSTISVQLSKHSEVSVAPANGKFAVSELTQDYTESKLHRFKIPGSKNERHVCGPSSQLYVSNLPADTTDEELVALFENHGCTQASLFGKNKNMAFIHFTTVEEAVVALMTCHNAKFKDKHIRLTFSHSKKSDDSEPYVPL